MEAGVLRRHLLPTSSVVVVGTGGGGGIVSSVAVGGVTTATNSAPRISIFDACHRKIRLLGGGPVAFLGGLMAKARRKEKEVCSAPGPEEPKLYLEEAVLQERKLPDVDLRLLVDLPAGLDYNEWLASHTIAFFDHINLVYGTISEFCTMSGCPDMTGPGLRTYLWFDEKGKKTKVAAPQYIDYVMTFTQKTISDESIFPTKYANDFPSSFESIVKKILRLLFHVTAHLYHCHFREILLLNLHAHLNCVFAHFSLFDERFSLVDPKETEILRDLVLALRLHSPSSQPPSTPPNTTSTTTTAATSSSNNNSSCTSTCSAMIPPPYHHQHHHHQSQQQHHHSSTSMTSGEGCQPSSCPHPHSSSSSSSPMTAPKTTIATAMEGTTDCCGGDLGEAEDDGIGRTTSSATVTPLNAAGEIEDVQ